MHRSEHCQSSHWRSHIGPALLVLAAACGSSATQGARTDSASTASTPIAAGALPDVTVVTVTMTPAGRKVAVPGELRPFQDARLYPKVSGFVREVLVDRGAKVSKGRTLARIEAPELDAQVSEAGSRVQAAEGALAEAVARYQGSRATYNRIKAAAATDGVVSPDELERALSVAHADSARLAAAQAQASAARSSHRAVTETGGYLAITAPFDGVITERNVSPGALVGPASGSGSPPMFAIEDDSHLRLVIALPEAYVGSAAAMGGVSFQVRAFPADTFRAVLARRARTIDPRTRSELLEFDVANPTARLEAGMYADVLVPVVRSSPTMTVPSTAVATSVDGPFVIAVAGDTTHWVRVRKGDTVGDRVEVFGDLHDGQRIVERATEEIRSGVRIRIAAPAAAK
jgi:membrane fusion protein (multidrug efflux system)